MERDPPQAHVGDLLELAAAALHAWLQPWGREQADLSAQGPGRTRPVLLVPGWSANRSCLALLEAYLKAVGFDRVWAVNCDPGQPLRQQAVALAERVERVAQSCSLGRGSLDLVAHCTGGLVARIFLQELGGAARVDRCISLATPHLGTTSPAWLATPLAADLRPGSAFLDRLNDPARRAPGIRFSSLWADLDLSVIPQDKAIYPQGESIRIAGVGHSGLLLHPETLRQVADRLALGQTPARTSLTRAARLAGQMTRLARRLAGGVRKKPRDTG